MKRHWHVTQVVTREMAEEGPAMLDTVEQMFREHVAEMNAKAGLTIVSDTGIEWFESPNVEPADYNDAGRRFMTERAWRRGDPIEWDYLYCRMSGLSVANTAVTA